jgi:PAS domain-containing protein
MGQTWIDFDAPDLAARVERLSGGARDELPFGVIHLDRDGTVLFYSATESKLSGYGMTPLGRNFYEVGRNPANGDLRARIEAAMETGPVDLEFGWTGDLIHRELRIRVQSAGDGGVWLCIERDTKPVRPRARQART